MSGLAAASQNGGWRGRVAALSLGLSLFAVFWFMLAAIGTKLGFWKWTFGLGTLTFKWGPLIVMAALGLSVIAMILALIKAPRKRPFMIALAALLVAGLSFGRIAAFKGQAERLPPLHEAQTDWSNPIQPSEALLSARQASGAMNPIEDAPVVPEAANDRWPGTGGRLVSDLQEEAEFDPGEQKSAKAAPYPKLDTLVTAGIGEDMTFDAALRAVKSKGWTIITEDPASGKIEATQTSFWFEFKDDVIVRVLPDGPDGSRIDVRSISRVGLSDLGANSRRVRDLLDTIERELQ